ncbi:MAG TPA: cupredoxin domain-containing protein [Candidatus Eisenbacteria bacterium]|nr:cupredoxin domain-containing protein [Candidatus Eisenbacteria bacterium]
MKRMLPIVAVAALALAAGACARRNAAAPSADAVYAIAVTENGFEPAETKVPKDRPVTLVFTRRTDATCATSVEIPSLHRALQLPLNQPVRVEVPAGVTGTLSYQCGMHMVTGRIVVE